MCCWAGSRACLATRSCARTWHSGGGTGKRLSPLGRTARRCYSTSAYRLPYESGLAWSTCVPHYHRLFYSPTDRASYLLFFPLCLHLSPLPNLICHIRNSFYRDPIDIYTHQHIHHNIFQILLYHYRFLYRNGFCPHSYTSHLILHLHQVIYTHLHLIPILFSVSHSWSLKDFSSRSLVVNYN